MADRASRGKTKHRQRRLRLARSSDVAAVANETVVGDEVVADLVTDVSGLDTRLDAEEAVTADIETRVAALEAASADHETRIAALEANDATQDATLADHETRITALEP